MDLEPDELAGVCDLFGGLTPTELATAVEELAFRRDAPFDREAHDAAVADARESFVLEALAPSADEYAGVDADEDLFVPGPRAFAVVPEGGADLPHILDVPRRDVAPTAVAAAVRERLDAAVESLGPDADVGRVDDLLDVTYDAEALTGAAFDEVRERLDEHAAADAE